MLAQVGEHVPHLQRLSPQQWPKFQLPPAFLCRSFPLSCPHFTCPVKKIKGIKADPPLPKKQKHKAKTSNH